MNQQHTPGLDTFDLVRVQLLPGLKSKVTVLHSRLEQSTQRLVKRRRNNLADDQHHQRISRHTGQALRGQNLSLEVHNSTGD